MQDLIALYRHNAWANRKVFDLAFGVDAALLAAPAPGTRDTVTGTLKHLARVEYGYLAMMEQRAAEPRQEYEARDFSWFSGHLDDVALGYQQLLASATDELLDRDMGIPWFDFPISVREGLRQVLTHSAQHRSQVLSWLSARGIETPDLDYALMLGEGVRP
jgi:uncharacterized damage-inducible protein DinB